MCTNQQSWEKAAIMWFPYLPVMMKETLNLMNGHFKKRSEPCSVCPEPFRLQLQWPALHACCFFLWCWVLYRGFWFESISTFCVSFDSNFKVFLPDMIFTLLVYLHWHHTITAFPSVDNLAPHFGHTPTAWTPSMKAKLHVLFNFLLRTSENSCWGEENG